MKALVSVIFKTEAEGGRRSDPCSSGFQKGPCYRPQFVVLGGKGDPVDFNFNETITLTRGVRHVTEIESIWDLLDYSEFKTGAKFVVLEGSKIVGEGRILATQPPTKE